MLRNRAPRRAEEQKVRQSPGLGEALRRGPGGVPGGRGAQRRAISL